MPSERLRQQLAFLMEIDRLKEVLRQTYLTTESRRRENSAEHSWHLALMAMVLAEYADEPARDMGRVIKMVLIHDLVEIDAGDTYIYDTQAQARKLSEERRAAERIFGLLPSDQAEEFRALWEEFEARETPEARFAAALDRLMPLLHNYHTQGVSWQEHQVRSDKVYAMNRPRIQAGSRALWELADSLIKDAIGLHYLEE